MSALPRFVASIVVDAPPGALFGLVESPSHPLLPPGGPRLSRVSPQIGPGSVYRWEFRRLGIRFRVESEVTVYEPARRIAFRGTSGWSMEAEALFLPGQGQTRLEFHMNYRLPLPLRWLIPGALVRLGVWHALRNLKEGAEALSDSPPPAVPE